MFHPAIGKGVVGRAPGDVNHIHRVQPKINPLFLAQFLAPLVAFQGAETDGVITGQGMRDSSTIDNLPTLIVRFSHNRCTDKGCGSKACGQITSQVDTVDLLGGHPFGQELTPYAELKVALVGAVAQEAVLKIPVDSPVTASRIPQVAAPPAANME